MTRALFRDPTSERDVPWIPGQTVIVKACMGQHHECRDLSPGGVSTQAVVVAAPVAQADAGVIDSQAWNQQEADIAGIKIDTGGWSRNATPVWAQRILSPRPVDHPAMTIGNG